MLIVLAGLLVSATPAAAVPLPPSSTPLPGSSFQGGDGNHADSPPLSDWQGFQGTGRVVHSPDPNAQDSVFTAGSEEDKPGEWDLSTAADGVSPGKANILDVWSAVDQPAADTFLYLAFTRESANGTTYLAFELNRDSRLWDNGHATIPCRRTGDILVAYEASTDGVDVILQKWTTTSTDLATGCARTGRLTDAARFIANQDAQGAVNTGVIANYLPGFTPAPGTIAAGEFGEASLNLTRLLGSAFGDGCMAFSSVWMHSRSSQSENSSMEDYVGPQPLAIRSCAASGTKFFDSNANRARDPGEPGIPRFVIWADYNNDGVRDDDEPFSLTDGDGRYVIYDIKPPNRTYTLRETLLTARTVGPDWVCSYPATTAPSGRFGCASGPIDVATTPNATGRDFGNWFPAELTLTKQIEPVDDPGRFDLLVDDEVVLPGAGDGGTITVSRPPGTYTVSDRPAAGGNAADYDSTVECGPASNRRGGLRPGTTFTGLTLVAGDRASCVFRNIRADIPRPAIGIRKTGPVSATAGDTLRDTLYVTNPGDVPFAAADVVVTDAGCDAPPALVSKGNASGPDPSPDTLNPGDTWTYQCSHATSAGGENCRPTSVPNSAVVTGSIGGAELTDDDSITTTLVCPNNPQPPDPIQPINPPGPGPPPNPDQPGPVEPPGPTPPDAGLAGIASVKFRQATQGCIRSHVPRVNFAGTRIATVRVYVNGRLRRNLTVQTLQRRVTPRVTLAPGRYRVSARVTFERGAGTPPVSFAGAVRICGARSLPRFTG